MAMRLGLRQRVQLCSAVPLLRGFSSAIQLSDSPYAIQEALLESGTRRAYAVYNPVTEAVDVSHECMVSWTLCQDPPHTCCCGSGAPKDFPRS